MFHVSTMLPMQPQTGDEPVQQLARKRYIGNDIVVIVFQESSSTPFDVTSVASEFNHVWFVVQPIKMHGKTHYRLAVCCKSGVGEFGPSRGPPQRSHPLAEVHSGRGHVAARRAGVAVCGRVRGELLEVVLPLAGLSVSPAPAG